MALCGLSYDQLGFISRLPLRYLLLCLFLSLYLSPCFQAIWFVWGQEMPPMSSKMLQLAISGYTGHFYTLPSPNPRPNQSNLGLTHATMTKPSPISAVDHNTHQHHYYCQVHHHPHSASKGHTVSGCDAAVVDGSAVVCCGLLGLAQYISRT